MEFTSHLPAGLREHAERRLRENLVGWFTTVRPSGQPVSVPVGFVVQDDDTILVYSQPGKDKLRNVAANPRETVQRQRPASLGAPARSGPSRAVWRRAEGTGRLSIVPAAGGKHVA